MAWTVEYDRRAAAEVGEWPADMRARLQRIIELVETRGPQAVGMPHVRYVEGKVWEMRPKGRDGIGRALYFAATGRRIVILHAFVKKTETTPRREIRTAMERLADHT
jgi:phage-related protein